MTTLDVGLGARGYPIHIGPGTIDRIGDVLNGTSSRRAVVVTNAVVASLHLGRLKASLAKADVATDVVLLPDGEAHKNSATLLDLLTRLLELRIDRATTIVALGGGVIGDIAGFAAAIYQRGLSLVQVPTTLLAQVDSSVGGKTGINHPLGKNMIGAFWQPRAVVVDTDCLLTLPDRELRAGIAEIIKHGAIRDADFFEWLEAHMAEVLAKEGVALTHAIHRSCEIKAAIVAADERETGERALLNFGHTFGHAIEAAQGYGAWLHGEAVAAGMVCAARLSERVCGLDASHSKRIESLVAMAKLPTAPPKISADRWLDLMGRDKKVADGSIRFVLLEALGHAVLRRDLAAADVLAAIRD